MTAVLSIGYGRKLFTRDDPERARLAACAETVEELHLVVFSRRSHCLSVQREGQLFLHPTNARTRIGMLIAALRIGAGILASSRDGEWVVSAQDPFEAGLVGYWLARRFGVPLQVQEHGDFFGSDWWRTERLLNRLRYRFGTWLLRRAGCIRTVSARAARHISTMLGSDSACITTLAVTTDTERFAAVARERTYNRAESVTVLALGRLVREKNLPLLLRACAQATARVPLRLIIAGSGPEEAYLRRMAASLPELETVFLPWTDDVPGLLAQADLFALSSYREGWARVLLEAMAAGLPTVTTEVGCVGEALRHGVHGEVVPVADEAAFAEALERLAGDAELREHYGRVAARDVATYTASRPPYPDAWRATLRGCEQQHHTATS